MSHELNGPIINHQQSHKAVGSTYRAKSTETVQAPSLTFTQTHTNTYTHSHTYTHTHSHSHTFLKYIRSTVWIRALVKLNLIMMVGFQAQAQAAPKSDSHVKSGKK